MSIGCTHAEDEDEDEDGDDDDDPIEDEVTLGDPRMAQPSAWGIRATCWPRWPKRRLSRRGQWARWRAPE
jgi:hypothetical protein